MRSVLASARRIDPHEAGGVVLVLALAPFGVGHGREREVGRKFNRWLDVVLMQKML